MLTAEDERFAQERQRLAAQNVADKLEAARFFRRVLSIQENPPIDRVIACGAVPDLVDVLRSHAPNDYEAAWALTNIAAGTHDHCTVVVDAGVVPTFVELLSCEDSNLVGQAVWALGNIAGDRPKYRDMILDLGALDAMARIIQQPTELGIFRNAIWATSNLCRGKPHRPVGVFLNALDAYVGVLSTSEDTDAVADASWGLAYISEGSSEHVAAVVDSGVLRRLVELITSASHVKVGTAVRVLGNCAVGTESQTQAVVDAGAVPVLLRLLDHDKANVRKEACWTLSNITAGSDRQALAVVMAESFTSLLRAAVDETHAEVRREAAWAVSNATSSGSVHVIEELVTAGGLRTLCRALTPALGVNDYRTIELALDGIGNILQSKRNDVPNPYAEALRGDDEAMDTFEKLQTCASWVTDLVWTQVALLVEYFDVEAEVEERITNLDIDDSDQTQK